MSYIINLLAIYMTYDALFPLQFGHTPLMMARKYDVITLLQKYSTCYEDYPVHTFSKVILCGDTGAGKSSLAKVQWIGPGLLGFHTFDTNACRV